MLGFFKTKPILPEEDIHFQVATYQWLLKHFGGKYFFKETQLILPNRVFFPSKVESNEEAAIATFERVKQYAGMSGWNCVLEAQEEDVDAELAPALIVQNAPSSPHGTFQAKENNKVLITYNPQLVSNPTQLVATYAHELAHYLTSSAPEEPPEGWDNWEFATDITATFLGFGVFMASSAFNFQQYANVDSQGWHYSRSGYLSEEEHIFALAIFLLLQNTPTETVSPYLTPHLTKKLKQAIKYINNTNIISTLQSVQYIQPQETENNTESHTEGENR